MRDDDGGEVKYVRYQPHPTSKTGKLKSMTLSFGKVKIDRQKPQIQNPYKMKADPHGIARSGLAPHEDKLQSKDTVFHVPGVPPG